MGDLKGCRWRADLGLAAATLGSDLRPAGLGINPAVFVLHCACQFLTWGDFGTLWTGALPLRKNDACVVVDSGPRTSTVVPIRQPFIYGGPGHECQAALAVDFICPCSSQTKSISLQITSSMSFSGLPFDNGRYCSSQPTEPLPATKAPDPLSGNWSYDNAIDLFSMNTMLSDLFPMDLPDQVSFEPNYFSDPFSPPPEVSGFAISRGSDDAVSRQSPSVCCAFRGPITG